MVQQKSFLTFLLLSIITCGIYSYYYLYRMTQDINQMAGDDGYYTDPVVAVLLTIVTCGFYSWYWLYQQGNRMKRLADCNNVPCDENGTAYLLWAIIGSLLCGIGTLIAHFLMIRNFNNLAAAYNSHFHS